MKRVGIYLSLQTGANCCWVWKRIWIRGWLCFMLCALVGVTTCCVEMSLAGCGIQRLWCIFVSMQVDDGTRATFNLRVCVAQTMC